MIPPHVLFANPNRFDLDTLVKLYDTNKEWASYCNDIKEDVIQRTFERYKMIHRSSIDSSNTLFSLVPFKNYLQLLLEVKEGRYTIKSFPKKIPDIFVKKIKKITMQQVYPTLHILINLQEFISAELINVPEEIIYPFQMLNMIMIYQAVEKICVEHRLKDLIEHETFIQATINKCNVILRELNNAYKKINHDTRHIYYYCARYIRRIKRMLYMLKKGQ